MKNFAKSCGTGKKPGFLQTLPDVVANPSGKKAGFLCKR